MSLAAYFLVVTIVTPVEEVTRIVEMWQRADAYYGNALCMLIVGVGVYAQKLLLRTRAAAVAAHLCLRALQAQVISARCGDECGGRWLRSALLPMIASVVGGWLLAAAIWRGGAFRWDAMADGLDGQRGVRSLVGPGRGAAAVA